MSELWGPTHLGNHFYQNVCYSNLFPKECLERVKHLEIRDDDIMVATFPKTGTTWMENIVREVAKHDCFELASRSSHGPHNVSLFVEMSFPGTPPLIDEIEKIEGPRLLKTHIYPEFFEKTLKEKKTKFIVVIRNEKDTLVSAYHYNKKVPALNFIGNWDQFYSTYRAGETSSGNWIDWYLKWYEYKDNENVLFIHFEDIKEDPAREITKVADFIGRKINNLDSILKETHFDNLIKKEAFNLRKGLTGEWRDFFTDEQNQETDKLYEEQVVPKGLIVRFSV